MTMTKRFSVALFAVVALGTAGASLAGEPQLHVVGANEIQVRIDQHIGQADADRQAIQALLQREDVRQLAGSAGLDLDGASAAAAVLSGSSLERLAAQAREMNAALAGGDSNVVVSTTAIIIILLILILVLR